MSKIVKSGTTYIITHRPNKKEVEVSKCYNEIVDFFDKTYVNGTYRQIDIPGKTNIRFRNCPPLFPLEQWNTHDLTLADSDRTNNQTEGWNNRFSRLVGHKHPSIWVLITKMRLEVATDETKLAQQSLGLLSNKRKLPYYEKNQNLLKNLCLEIKEGNKSLPEFLTAVCNSTHNTFLLIYNLYIILLYLYTFITYSKIQYDQLC